MPSPDSVLEIENLTKKYRRVAAVDDVNVTIGAGEFVALIGPNGAGKSTTMGCIAGTVAADNGSVSIDGITVTEEPVEARRRLGYVPQHLTLLDYLTGEEYLDFVADLRDLDPVERNTDIDELLTMTELDDSRDVVIREYSGGMLRKLALSAALVGSPRLLVLDESFVGLDPESTHRLRKKLVEHCDAGGSILLSSHILDMLEPMCDRFLILHEGTLARDLDADELAELKATGRIDNLTDLYLQTTGKLEAVE